MNHEVIGWQGWASSPGEAPRSESRLGRDRLEVVVLGADLRRSDRPVRWSQGQSGAQIPLGKLGLFIIYHFII